MQTNPFATEAAEYAHLRPTYPDVLFGFLSTVVASRELAWDGSRRRDREVRSAPRAEHGTPSSRPVLTCVF